MLYVVTEADTAAAVGSGDVAMLATPRLIAWMEAATVRAAKPHLGSGETTVGTAIRVRHRRPTAVGGTVDVTATTSDSPSGRRLTFHVKTTDGSGRVVADGEIDRAVVDRQQF